MLLGNFVALGQAGNIHGQVRYEQAGGVAVPLESATVDLFRLDLPGKYETKTDEKGHYEFGDVSSVGKYILAFSAPNAEPAALLAVGLTGHSITLLPGNGKRLTQDEAQALIGVFPSQGNENKDSKIIVSRSLEAGNQALAARRYNDAIIDYDRGIKADSHQAPLWTGRAIALNMRGADAYNAAIISQGEEAKAVRMKAALLDLRESVEAANKAVELARTGPASQSSEADLPAIRVDALRARAEAMRLLVTTVDPAQVDAAVAAYQEYLETETDKDLRLQTQRQAAQMLLKLREPAKALLEFQHILESTPDDVEALLGMALSIYALDDRTKDPEAAAYLQRFVDGAPKSHPRRLEATAVLDYLASHYSDPLTSNRDRALTGRCPPGTRCESLSADVLKTKAVILGVPKYHLVAKLARVSGTIQVQVTIDEQGRVDAAQAIGGNPLLLAVSVKAALASRFMPTLVEGKPARVTGVIMFNFVDDDVRTDIPNSKSDQESLLSLSLHREPRPEPSN